MLLCFDLPMAISPVGSDLDLQLKKHGVHRLIVRGLIARTPVEATMRYAAELGFDVTMVKDATADYSDRRLTDASQAVTRGRHERSARLVSSAKS